MATSTLDHVIHLSPPGRLQEAIDHFQRLGFIVLPGGQHADGLTYNALVVFDDGVYLELIAFTHAIEHYPEGTPERNRRENHWWASKNPGWIDWANLGLNHDVENTINQRARGLVRYLQPQEGGRTKPDGTELRWRVTFPALEHGRGALPFFCEDVTPRSRRVPLEPRSNAQHPCGATGIAHIILLASAERMGHLSEQLPLVLGDQPEVNPGSQLRWSLETPSTVTPQGTKLVLASRDAASIGAAAEIVEVGFHIAVEPVNSVSLPSRIASASTSGANAFGTVSWCPPPPTSSNIRNPPAVGSLVLEEYNAKMRQDTSEPGGSGSDSSSPSIQPNDLSAVTPHKPREPMLGRGLACHRCRNRKQRCDGVQPSCTSCVVATSDCVYTPQTKVTKPKPRSTATEGLEEKLSRLQKEYADRQAAITVRVQESPVSSATASLTSHDSASPGADSEPELHGSSGNVYFPIDPQTTAFRAPDMPDEDRNVVIRIFFTGSQRLGCPILPERFFRRLTDPDPRRRPHPALINAMLLIGVAFTWWTPGYSTAKVHDLPPTTPPAETLLARAQVYLNESLSNMDRLQDHLQAAILLSYFFFQQGRLEEGQIISASNSRMAVHCRLHRIDQSVLDELRPGRPPLAPGQSQWDGTFLGRPEDSYELGIRIWTFWQSWYYDSVFAIIGGSPRVRPAERPTTVFPRRSAAYESGVAFNLHHHSFEELFANDPPELIKPTNEPAGVTHPLATYLKGIAILDRTEELFGTLQKTGNTDPERYIAEICKLHASLQSLLVDHLPVHQPELLETHRLTPQEAAALYCPLSERIVGHVLLHTATIQVCRVTRSLGLQEDQIRKLEVEAARGAVRTLRVFGEEVRKLSARMQGNEAGVSVKTVAEIQEHPCLLLSFLLTTVCIVLVDQIKILKTGSDVVSTVMEQLKLEEDLRLAVATMQHTAKSFPLLSIQVDKIYAYKAASDHQTFVYNERPTMWEYEKRLSATSSRYAS
ncbi:hypothetical protein FRB96_005216 [Tulasnella sp. 330]|nr:hypothetical protein FRB96_005216 [Tulasnella sp. 330]KAG8890138.1 hypothetical protein FRB98_000866 [Tulasnella sp. 332]